MGFLFDKKYVAGKIKYKVLGVKVSFKLKNNLLGKYKYKFLLPKKVRLDACTLCQLKCKSCYMRNDKPTVGLGYLKFSDFKKFVDDNKQIEEIELSNSGEIFLNPELDKIIKYAYEKNISLTAWNGVNFNTVSDEMIELLVKYQFKKITFSIDGASQETYEKYRVNGNFDTVISNIKKLNEFKKKYGSSYPELMWQYIVFGHNEKEIPNAKKLAQSLDVEIYFKLNWDESFSPIEDESFVKEAAGLKYTSRSEFLEKEKQEYTRNSCLELWSRPTINWDGKLLGCCKLYKDDFGVNVFKDGLFNALNSEKYVYCKRMIANAAAKRDDVPCGRCLQYNLMLKTNSFIKEEEIQD